MGQGHEHQKVSGGRKRVRDQRNRANYRQKIAFLSPMTSVTRLFDQPDDWVYESS